MAKPLVVLLILFGHSNLYAQLRTGPVPKKQPTMAQYDRDVSNQNCVYKGKISSGNRLKIFPFNRAVKVQLVSFKKPDSIHYTYLLPATGKAVDYSKLSEVVTLNALEIDSLTDILYNYGYRGLFYSFSENQCIYNPANAILFVDQYENAFAFIEICFQCGDYRSSEEKMKLGEICIQKYNLLRKFFLRNGVQYGIAN